MSALKFAPLTANSLQFAEMLNVDQHGSALFIHNREDGLTLNVTGPKTLATDFNYFQLQFCAPTVSYISKDN
jgi:hypothetical protein